MNVRSKFRPKYRLGAALVGALAASALLSGCVNNANFIDPQGPVALKESYLWWFIFYVAVGVWAVVTGVLIISIVRFRARPGAPTPRQLHGNTQIEIIWTVVPSLILFAVLVGTIYTLFSLGQPADPNTVTVKAIGHQWWWEFQYPGKNIVTADELHIPTGTVVHVELYSNNVIHSFWVPQLAGKTDVIPGQNNTTWLQADRTGTYRGECTEYCGEQHAHMNFNVVAQSPSDFQAWVSTQQATAAAPTAGDALAGQAIYNQRCFVCHVISGGGAKPNAAPIAPDLTHLKARQVIAGGVLSTSDADLKKWINGNADVKPGNDMGNQNLSDTDLNNIIAYLDTLK